MQDRALVHDEAAGSFLPMAGGGVQRQVLQQLAFLIGSSLRAKAENQPGWLSIFHRLRSGIRTLQFARQLRQEEVPQLHHADLLNRLACGCAPSKLSCKRNRVFRLRTVAC